MQVSSQFRSMDVVAAGTKITTEIYNRVIIVRPFNHNCLPSESEMGGQWFSGRVLDLIPRGREFEPHQRH